MSDRCETCDAFQLTPHAARPGLGVCRKGPPTVFIIGMQPTKTRDNTGRQIAKPVVVSAFPEVGNEDWCREFKEKTDNVTRKFEPDSPVEVGRFDFSKASANGETSEVR